MTRRWRKSFPPNLSTMNLATRPPSPCPTRATFSAPKRTRSSSALSSNTLALQRMSPELKLGMRRV